MDDADFNSLMVELTQCEDVLSEDWDGFGYPNTRKRIAATIATARKALADMRLDHQIIDGGYVAVPVAELEALRDAKRLGLLPDALYIDDLIARISHLRTFNPDPELEDLVTKHLEAGRVSETATRKHARLILEALHDAGVSVSKEER